MFITDGIEKEEWEQKTKWNESRYQANYDKIGHDGKDAKNCGAISKRWYHIDLESDKQRDKEYWKLTFLDYNEEYYERD